MGGAKHLTDSRSNVERTLGHPVCIAQFSLVRSTARGLGLEAIGPAHDAHAYRPCGLAEASPIGSRNRALRFASRLALGRALAPSETSVLRVPCLDTSA